MELTTPQGVFFSVSSDEGVNGKGVCQQVHRETHFPLRATKKDRLHFEWKVKRPWKQDNIKLIKLDAYGTMPVMEHKQIAKSGFDKGVRLK